MGSLMITIYDKDEKNKNTNSQKKIDENYIILNEVG